MIERQTGAYTRMTVTQLRITACSAPEHSSILTINSLDYPYPHLLIRLQSPKIVTWGVISLCIAFNAERERERDALRSHTRG